MVAQWLEQGTHNPWVVGSIPTRPTEELTTLAGMEQKVWTGAELEQLTPAEQDAIFQAGIVRNLDDVPEPFLARVRARLDEHIARTESPAR